MDENKVISIVVASGAGGEFLYHCLESLRSQVHGPEVELFVVDRCGGETLERLNRDYHFATIIPAASEHRLSVPELRALGVSQSKGDVVAIIEEHCIVPSNWVETIRDSFQDSDAAIGGPIKDKDYDRLQDWVVYFSEYHNYLPPWPEGNRYLLNGANIAYHREKLVKFLDVLDTGYWEVVLHPSLSQVGDFRSIPQMEAYHTGPFDYRYYLEQRYLLSRVWGGTQRGKVSQIKRLVYLITAPLLPLLLLIRIALRVLKDKRLAGIFIAAMPLLIPVVIAYVWGEWLGYLVGVGDALERVE